MTKRRCKFGIAAWSIFTDVRAAITSRAARATVAAASRRSPTTITSANGEQRRVAAAPGHFPYPADRVVVVRRAPVEPVDERAVDRDRAVLVLRGLEGGDAELGAALLPGAARREDDREGGDARAPATSRHR